MARCTSHPIMSCSVLCNVSTEGIVRIGAEVLMGCDNDFSIMKHGLVLVSTQVVLEKCLECSTTVLSGFEGLQ